MKFSKKKRKNTSGILSGRKLLQIGTGTLKHPQTFTENLSKTDSYVTVISQTVTIFYALEQSRFYRVPLTEISILQHEKNR